MAGKVFFSKALILLSSAGLGFKIGFGYEFEADLNVLSFEAIILCIINLL